MICKYLPIRAWLVFSVSSCCRLLLAKDLNFYEVQFNIFSFMDHAFATISETPCQIQSDTDFPLGILECFILYFSL